MNKSCYEKISENRYRESYGFYYDDFVIGEIIEHRPGRTLTEIDNIWQSLICMNKHPVHIDNEYAKHTEFGKLLISSAVTLAIVSGMSVSTLSAKAVANLGWDKVRLLQPVFVGDTIYAESQILKKRKSKSRPNNGVVTVRTRGIKSDGSVFMQYERSFLIPLNKETSLTQNNY